MNFLHHYRWRHRTKTSGSWPPTTWCPSSRRTRSSSTTIPSERLSGCCSDSWKTRTEKSRIWQSDGRLLLFLAHFRLVLVSAINCWPKKERGQHRTVDSIFVSGPSCSRFDFQLFRSFFQIKNCVMLLWILTTLLIGKWTVAWKCCSNSSSPG